MGGFSETTLVDGSKLNLINEVNIPKLILKFTFSLLNRGFASGPNWGLYSSPQTLSWVIIPPPPEICGSNTVHPIT